MLKERPCVWLTGLLQCPDWLNIVLCIACFHMLYIFRLKSSPYLTLNTSLFQAHWSAFIKTNVTAGKRGDSMLTATGHQWARKPMVPLTDWRSRSYTVAPQTRPVPFSTVPSTEPAEATKINEDKDYNSQSCIWSIFCTVKQVINVGQLRRLSVFFPKWP